MSKKNIYLLSLVDMTKVRSFINVECFFAGLVPVRSRRRALAFVRVFRFLAIPRTVSHTGLPKLFQKIIQINL